MTTELHISANNLVDSLKGIRIPFIYGTFAAVAVAIFSLFIPNQYTSQARLLPTAASQASGPLGGLASAAATLGLGAGSGDVESAGYVDVLHSRWLSERLLATEFTFHQKAWYFGNPRLRKVTLMEYLKAKNADQGFRALKGLCDYQRDLKSNLLIISVTTKSPDLSQQVAQNCVSLLNEFLVKNSQTHGSIKATFASERLKEAQAEALIAEERMRIFMQSNRNYNLSLDPGIRLKGARLEADLGLRRQLVQGIAISRESALMDEKDDTHILNVLDGGYLPSEKSKPARTMMVLVTLLLVGGGTWATQNLNWIRTNFIEEKKK